MAKQTKYVKLGKNASIFWDSSCGLKVQNNEVVIFQNKHKLSKRVDKALKNGHLEFATEEEYNDFLSDLAVEGTVVAAAPEKKEVDFNKMKKSELVDYIVENSETEESDVDGLTKAELIQFIEDGFKFEDEEDDE